MIKNQLGKVLTYNLLESDTYQELSATPRRLRDSITAQDRIVVIDEVQKIPALLDEVHLLIESKKIHFLLTGSSSRALKRKGVNLLGGRARSIGFHPFSYIELKKEFGLDKALSHGLIPSIYFSEDPNADLKSYVGDYLKEEIASEGLTRNIPAFSRFLEVAACCHGKQINYETVANDARVPSTTVREYFQILRDTLIGHSLPHWGKGTKRKEATKAKFYFFDNGVANRLMGRTNLAPATPEYGDAFEAYIFHEIKTYLDYNMMDTPFSYWRTYTDLEVDFVLNDEVAIEVKSSTSIGSQDLKGLKAIREEGSFKKLIVVSREKSQRIVDGIVILPWANFLEELWSGDLLK